jgi:hypothetical protein
MLNTVDNNIQTNIAQFDYVKFVYRIETNPPVIRTHFVVNGNCIGKSKADAAGTEEKGTGEEEAKVLLENAFNISKIGAQTRETETIIEGTEAESVSFGNFKYNVTQWDIFDTYMADQQKQQGERDTKAKGKGFFLLSFSSSSSYYYYVIY